MSSAVAPPMKPPIRAPRVARPDNTPLRPTHAAPPPAESGSSHSTRLDPTQSFDNSTPPLARPAKRARKAVARPRQPSSADPGPMTPPQPTRAKAGANSSGRRRREDRTTSALGPPPSALSSQWTGSQGPITPSVGRPIEVDEEGPEAEEDFPMIRCGWNNCGQGFWILEDLLDHLVGEKGHVPLDPNAPRGQKCPCEWVGCSKAGKPQGSRMALLVHLRSHTGEKPFCCHKPECDKTFSRTDALAKHVRVSHGEILPSGRKSGGTNKKIKGEDSEGEDLEAMDETVTDLSLPLPDSKDEKEDWLEIINPNSKLFGDEVDEEFRTAEERKDLEDLKVKFPSTDPAFLELVVMQAKMKFLLGEKEFLDAELEALESKERSLEKEKDTYLDAIMTREIGPESYVIWRETIENIISVPDSPATSGVPPNESQASDQRRKQSLVMTEGSSGRGVPVTSSGRRKKMPKLEPGV